MPRVIDLKGQRFGRWTVLEYVKGKGWLCECDCGNRKIVGSRFLRDGRSNSCGCYSIETKHNKKIYTEKTRKLSNAWKHMKNRCNNPKDSHYSYYGGRGIKVCDEWNGRHGYKNFRRWALENGFSEEQKGFELTLDRIDVDGNYEPNNCRWVGAYEQSNNRRNCIYITHNGETHTVTEWERILGFQRSTIRQRIRLLGWNPEKALTTPLKKIKKRGSEK